MSLPPVPAPSADGVRDDEFVFTDDELLGPVDPAEAPLRGTTPGRAVGRYFRRYGRFSGRSSRSEYWWVALLHFAVFTGGGILALVLHGLTSENFDDDPGLAAGLIGTVLVIYLFGTIVPNLALTVRRLHDANFSGFFYFLTVIPFFGGLVGLIFSLLPGAPEGVRFDRRTGVPVG